ncbi:hypothetical protein RJ639_033940 [Escallonia herrerae]|uniref:AT3G52170-like helix-turn-helix domain-containing protein n=1 Tax=Escallonia herrerae TaxID=1293975 RepID=A0AA89BKF3_9ASTE|nr:hypothetical protein RJ639_033940 [Escallonia herrerae]
MHATKGGWVGQTFALAKCNDSGGKKSRIRRSKEERKALVESFIKKYQNSHSGNFPSLNLTHKEVGGSFYTVREIVREIIQESRVLGPAKLSLDEQNADSFLQQYPLGTISVEPQIIQSSSNETQTITLFVPNHHQHTNEEPNLESSGLCLEPQQWSLDNRELVNGKTQVTERNKVSGELICAASKIDKTLEGEIDGEIVNGRTHATERNGVSDEPICAATRVHKTLEGESDRKIGNGSTQATERYEISDEPIYAATRVDKILEGEKNGNKHPEASSARITPSKADVVVETFPLRPVFMTINGLDENLGAPGVANGILEEREMRVMKLEAGQHDILQRGINFLDNPSTLVDEKGDSSVASPLGGTNYHLVDETAYPSLETLNSATAKDAIVLDIKASADLEFEHSSSAGNNLINDPNGVCAENLKGINSSSPHEHSFPKGAVAIRDKCDTRHGDSSQKLTDPTLERMNLESWEATTEKSAGPESTSPLALIKAFLAALVKFWIR